MINPIPPETVALDSIEPWGERNPRHWWLCTSPVRYHGVLLDVLRRNGNTDAFMVRRVALCDVFDRLS
jgi:hypothetical protein